MIKEKTNVIAIIPARGGSKGIPRKNIKILAGKPLIAWTIETAKKSKHFDKIIVSTDDREIGKISKEYGAEVPFLRPKELAKDESPTIDAIMHAINWFEKKGEYYKKKGRPHIRSTAWSTLRYNTFGYSCFG